MLLQCQTQPFWTSWPVAEVNTICFYTKWLYLNHFWFIITVVTLLFAINSVVDTVSPCHTTVNHTFPFRFLKAVAYRWIIKWLCGLLGWDHSSPLPACIYHKLRIQFPVKGSRGYIPSERRA